MIGIELQILRFGFLCCLGVCPRTWQAPCATYTQPPFDNLFSLRVSVLRRDRLTVFIFSLEFLHSHSVSVQRRDRSLYFYYIALPSSPFLPVLTPTQCICPKTWQVTVLSTALLYQGPLLIWLLSFLSFYQFEFTQCICPKTWQVTVLLLHRFTKVPLLTWIFWFVSSRLLCFSSGLLSISHSVSVQRRDRSLFSPPLPLITQCICPKTWQVLCILYPPSLCFAFRDTSSSPLF